MRREVKTIIHAALWIACVLVPLVARAQDEGPREIDLPNPMTPHTWFIIVAVGAFLTWCISYVLSLQRDSLSDKTEARRESLLRRKEELLDRLAKLESQKEAGTIPTPRYEKEFRKTRVQLSDVLDRLRPRQDSTER
jgi:hypothetical protein